MKILLVRLDRIGDVLLTTPAIEALRSACPDCRIAMMVGPHAREIVEGNPYLDEVIVYDKEGTHRGWTQTLKFAFALRKKKFDTAFILHPTVRSHVLAFLAGIPRRVGYDKKFGFFLTNKLPEDKPHGLKHESDYALDMLRLVPVPFGDVPIGIDAAVKPALYFPLKTEDKRLVARHLIEMGVKDSDIVIAIHPGASCPSKVWPPERFAEVADKLASEFDARIVIVSGKSDVKLCDRLTRASKRGVISFAGRTSLGELAALLKRSSLFISNDSGPVHLAVAVGAPVISIFGRKDPGLSPRRWGPLGEKDIALHKDVGCLDCKAHNCELGFKCLLAITVDDVVEAARKILREP